MCLFEYADSAIEHAESVSDFVSDSVISSVSDSVSDSVSEMPLAEHTESVSDKQIP